MNGLGIFAIVQVTRMVVVVVAAVVVIHHRRNVEEIIQIDLQTVQT
jgi:glycerol-3-phosphate acyltransferase PlsY